MKIIWSLILVAGGLAVSSVQAGVMGDLRLTFDWNSLNISGVAMTPYVDGDGISSEAYGFLGYGEPFTRIDSEEVYHGSVSRTYSDAEVDISAGYNEITNQSFAQVKIDNDSAVTARTGYAETGRALYYQATSTGSVTFNINYSLLGSVEIEEKKAFEYINAIYDYQLSVEDSNIFEQVFNETLLSNGGDEENADDVALAASQIASVGSLGLNEQFIDVLELYANCDSEVCKESVDEQGILSIAFDVEKDGLYFVEVRGAANAFSTVVPVPAAAWMFASGLLGLVGVAKRKKS